MIIMMTSLLNACSGGMLSLDTDSDSPIDKHPKDSLTDNSGGVNNPQDTPDTDNDSETSPSDDIISGTVRCLDGKGVAGVVVSDGLNTVQTDDKGRFVMDTDSESRYVFKPSETTTPATPLPSVSLTVPLIFFASADSAAAAISNTEITIFFIVMIIFMPVLSSPNQ